MSDDINPADEERVRVMLRRRAASIDPADAWASIERRIATPAQPGRRPQVLAVAAVLVLLAGAVAVYATSRPDRETLRTAGGDGLADGAASTMAAEVEPVWPVTQVSDLARVADEFAAGERDELRNPETAAAAYLRAVLPDSSRTSVELAQGSDEIDAIATYRNQSAAGVVFLRRADGGFYFVHGSTDDRLVSTLRYDGERLVGQVQSNQPGKLRYRYVSVDATDPVVEDSEAIGPTEPVNLDEAFGNKPGLVVTLVLDASGLGVATLRLTDEEAAPGPPAPAIFECSGFTVTDDMLADLEHDGDETVKVPAAVEAARDRIVEAARACDLDAVAAMAAAQFHFTFGDNEVPPASFWRDAELQGEPVMRMLVLSLHLEPVVERVPETGQTFYVWPGAAGRSAQPRHWEALDGLYPDADLARWRREGVFYGYRVGFTASGEWLYFVAGD